MEILKISKDYENWDVSSSDGREFAVKHPSLEFDGIYAFCEHATKDDHFESCARFVPLSDDEMAELEQWRREFLLPLEYARNPPKDPEDY